MAKTYKSKISKFQVTANKSEFPKQKIQSSKDAADFIRQFYEGDIEVYESFFILLLNRANITTGYAKISQGGVAGTVVDIKLVGKYIVDTLSSAVIIAHNHPSGNLRPSQADINMTKKVKETARILDSQLLDHVILTEEGYYSFADEGIL